MPQRVASTPHRARFGRRLVAGGLTLIILATLLPSGQESVASLCIVCGDTGTVDAILNILLFVPLGAGLALLGVRRWRALAGMCALTALIETLQLAIIPGRDATLGDFLMNSLGGTLGFYAFARSHAWRLPHRRLALWFVGLWTAGWFAEQSIASWALAPSNTPNTYYGQINRSGTRFPGIVHHISIGDDPIPDHILGDSPRIRELLASRTTVTEAVVTPNGPTTHPVSIVRIADARGNEILIMQQSKSDLIFSLRARSAGLRLRHLLFRLPGAFPPRDSAFADTLHLSAVYGQTSVTLRSRTAHRVVERAFPLTPALAYIMIFPFDVYTNGALIKSILSSMWIAALVLPIGYWGWFGTQQADRHSNGSRAYVKWVAGTALILAVGLAAVPALFGLMPATTWEWVAAAIGVLLGRALAARTAAEFNGVRLH